MANPNESQQDLMTLYEGQCAAVVATTAAYCCAISAAVWPHRSGARQDETVKSLGLSDSIEDILIPQGRPHPILGPAEKINGLFIYYVLDSERANRVRRRRR